MNRSKLNGIEKSNIEECNPLLISIVKKIMKKAKKMVYRISRGKAVVYFRIVIRDQTRPLFRPDEIRDMVAEALKIPTEVVQSPSRRREVVEARQIAMTIIKETYKKNLSLKNIGSYFGGRDHSTVIHAHDTFNTLYDRDEIFTSKVDTCKNFIDTQIPESAK